MSEGGYSVIIGLVGKKSPMKSRLREYLANKSFYMGAISDLARLENDKNYVIDVLDSGEVQVLRERKAALVWIGEKSRSSSEFDLAVSSKETEEVAQEKLDHLVLSEMRKQGRPDWEEYFMKIAQVASMRSNCIKRKVGAVIVRDKRIISTGYNGTPRGTKNCNEGGCPRCNNLASSGTKLDECLCSHAEENAITQAAYHGTSVKEGTLYTTFAPCLMCSKMIINSGIGEVVFNLDYPLNDTSFELFEQAGVTIRQHRLT
jgi:dCMP deaminase